MMNIFEISRLIARRTCSIEFPSEISSLEGLRSSHAPSRLHLTDICLRLAGAIDHFSRLIDAIPVEVDPHPVKRSVV
jgi:hypothetical protein